MSDDKPKKTDLTRIEDLSEFLHDEEDEEFSGLSTDPDITLPDEFNSSSDRDKETDFSTLEEDFEEEYASASEVVDTDDPFGEELNDNLEDSDLDNDLTQPDQEINFNEEFNGEFNSEFNSEFTEDFGDNFSNEEILDEEKSNSDVLDSDDLNFQDETLDDVLDDVQDETLDGALNEREDESENTPSEFSVEIPLEEPIDEILEIDSSDREPSDSNFNLESDSQQQSVNDSAKLYAPPETFKDLQLFSKNMSYGNLSHEGNPPFSIVLKEIKFQEDLDDIIIYLKEFKILKEEDEHNARKTLSRGSFLIPRLSEYAAILLCHKLRRFELTILMGLTEEITPAKSYSSDDSGLATKNNIYNNRSHNWIFEKKEVTFSDIIVCNTATAEGYEIQEYLGIATEFAIIDADSIVSTNEQESSLQASLYNDLVEKLKSHAIDKNGNAVVSISYALTPLVKNHSESLQQYKVTCTGNIVWLLKK